MGEQTLEGPARGAHGYVCGRFGSPTRKSTPAALCCWIALRRSQDGSAGAQ